VERELVHRDARADAAQHLAHAGRRGDADRVAERDLVHSELGQPDRDRRRAHGIDGALIRTAEHGREVAAHPQALRACLGDDRRKIVERLVDAHPDVLLVERLGNGGEDRHVLRAGGQRALEALGVRHQHDEAHLAERGKLRHGLVQQPQHLLGAGHLGHAVGPDERADLDVGQAGGGECKGEAHPFGGGDGNGFVLQAVARAHFDEPDVGRPGAGDRGHGRNIHAPPDVTTMTVTPPPGSLVIPPTHPVGGFL
jgi:hypothetical protein